MLHVIALAAALFLQTDQPEGQWQDFGAGPDGDRVSINVDSIAETEAGAQVMTRVTFARPTAAGAASADILTTFDCAGRTASRLEMVTFRADGQTLSRSDEGNALPEVNVAAGTPMDQVREMVCAVAGS